MDIIHNFCNAPSVHILVFSIEILFNYYSTIIQCKARDHTNAQIDYAQKVDTQADFSSVAKPQILFMLTSPTNT